MKDLKVILHATDFSPNAQAALAMACELARRREANLVVLHVTHPVPCHWPATSPSALYCCEHWKVADQNLRDLDCQGLLPERMLRTGEPAAVIASVAERVGADLIVLGQPRPGKWRWLIEERVAQTVVRKASCPVLVAARATAKVTEPAATTLQEVRRPATSGALGSAKDAAADRDSVFERFTGAAIGGYRARRQAAAR